MPREIYYHHIALNMALAELIESADNVVPGGLRIQQAFFFNKPVFSRENRGDTIAVDYGVLKFSPGRKFIFIDADYDQLPEDCHTIWVKGLCCTTPDHAPNSTVTRLAETGRRVADATHKGISFLRPDALAIKPFKLLKKGEKFIFFRSSCFKRPLPSVSLNLDCMLFKAKIATTAAYPSNSGIFRQSISQQEYIFSKTRIFYPTKLDGTAQDYFVAQDILKDKDKYELIALRKYEDVFSWTKDSKFQAQFAGGATLNLVPDFWNGIKLRIVHKRYWVQKHWNDLLKMLISSAIGFIFAICGHTIGYRQGYEGGVKAALTHLQDTIPKSHK